jgi:CarD family transcriptional regulator
VKKEFKIGERVVYPGHGVGYIDRKEPFEVEGEHYEVYVIKLIDKAESVFRVPVQNLHVVGVRRLIVKEQIKNVYAILQDRSVPTNSQTWNRRYRAYHKKVYSGDPIEIAKVVRDLALLKRKKSLSFGERNMYEKATGILTQEISLSRKVKPETIQKEIERIFEADAPADLKKKKKKDKEKVD